MAIVDHFWTVWPLLGQRLAGRSLPAGDFLTLPIDDPTRGELRLTGVLHHVDSQRLLLLVHGLGGHADSRYMSQMAAVALDHGVSVLRLNLRGSDRRPASAQSADVYHAGLWQDLQAVLANPRFADYLSLSVLGFSVGGHLTLRLATDVEEPSVQQRLNAVAAVCSPLDLAATVEHFDLPRNWLYRRYVLGGLRAIYRRLPDELVPSSRAQVEAARLLRTFDALTVVPRFGFDDVEHYYATQSVAPRLDHLQVPALLVAAEGDPMVTAASIRAGLVSESSRLEPSRLELRWLEQGGHVGFPTSIDLGQSAAVGLEPQLLSWLLNQSQSRDSQVTGSPRRISPSSSALP